MSQSPSLMAPEPRERQPRLTIVEQQLLSLIAELNVQDTKSDGDIRKQVQGYGLVPRMRHLMEEEEDPVYHSPLLQVNSSESQTLDDAIQFHTPPTTHQALKDSVVRAQEDVKPLKVRGQPLRSQSHPSRSSSRNGGHKRNASEGSARSGTCSTDPGATPKAQPAPTPISDKFMSPRPDGRLPPAALVRSASTVSDGRRSPSVTKSDWLEATSATYKDKPLPPLPYPTPNLPLVIHNRTPRPRDPPPRTTPTAPSPTQSPPRLPPKPRHSEVLAKLAEKGAYVPDRARKVLSVIAESIDDSQLRSNPENASTGGEHYGVPKGTAHYVPARGPGSSMGSNSSEVTLVERPETNTTLKAAKKTRDAAIRRAKTLLSTKSSVAVPRPGRQEREGIQGNRNKIRVVDF